MDSVILSEVIPPVTLSCVIIATKPVGGIKIGEIEYYVYIVSNSGSCAWVLDRYFQYVRFPYFSFEIFPIVTLPYCSMLDCVFFLEESDTSPNDWRRTGRYHCNLSYWDNIENLMEDYPKK